MGGRLELARSSDAGSVFALALPAERIGAAPPHSAPLSEQRVFAVAGRNFEGPYLADTLTGAGAQAELAADEAAAAARLARGDADFDAVIVDCRLGESATQRLAASARAAGAKRLFLLFSPLERRAFGEAALARFDGWLVKPLRAESLIARLADASPSAPTPRSGAPSARLDGLRLLLAEDNEVNALIATRHLEALGAQVTRAENGLRAVACVETALALGAPYDAILTDLFMPELDGLEATKRIRAAEARAGVAPQPIIAVTASAQEEDAKAARAAGVDAVLAKPLELPALGAAIHASRTRVAPSRDAQKAAAPPAPLATTQV
jgi:CheY-like chemotaxis protein